MKKDVKNNILNGPLADKFEKLAENIVNSPDFEIRIVYKKWRLKFLILLVLGIVPGAFFYLLTNRGLSHKIQTKYKNSVNLVAKKYEDAHPEFNNFKLVSGEGKVNSRIYDPIIESYLKPGRHVGGLKAIFDNPEKSSKWSMFGQNYLDRTNAKTVGIMSKIPFMGGAYSQFESSIVDFDLYRYIYTTKFNSRWSSINVKDAIYTAIHLRTDSKINAEICGEKVKITNYGAFIKWVTETRTTDDNGKVRVKRTQHQRLGSGGLAISMETQSKVNADIVIACKSNLILAAEKPFRSLKEHKPDFESIQFNKNYEFGIKGMTEQQLFKLFTPVIIDKFDDMQENYPGFVLSLKKDGGLMIIINSFERNQIPLSVDKPFKFASNAKYGKELIKNDLIYLNTITNIISTIKDLKII